MLHAVHLVGYWVEETVLSAHRIGCMLAQSSKKNENVFTTTSHLSSRVFAFWSANSLRHRLLLGLSLVVLQLWTQQSLCKHPCPDVEPRVNFYGKTAGCDGI